MEQTPQPQPSEETPEITGARHKVIGRYPSPRP
jgi:hypothetical protein